MPTFYFDTGVRPENRNALADGAVWRNGTMQFPFEADAPEGSMLLCMCDLPDMPMYRNAPRVKVFPVRDTKMASQFAYMRVPDPAPAFDPAPAPDEKKPDPGPFGAGPTPFVDGEEEHVANLHNEWACKGMNPVPEFAVRSDDVRRLERRCRAAEALLEGIVRNCLVGAVRQRDAWAHLEAAKKEDGR